MPRLEVTWSSETADGEKRQVCGRGGGDRWVFYARRKRFDNWEELASPTLEDCLALLDGVRRLGGRHRATAKDEAQLRAFIRKRFPDAG